MSSKYVYISEEEREVMGALMKLMDKYEPCTTTHGGLIHTENGLFIDAMIEKYDRFIRKKYRIPSRRWKIDVDTGDVYKDNGEYLLYNANSKPVSDWEEEFK